MTAFKLSVCQSPTPSNIAEDCQEKGKKKLKSAKGKKRKKKDYQRKKHNQVTDTKLKQAELKKPKEDT